jgi:hypothetical protein
MAIVVNIAIVIKMVIIKDIPAAVLAIVGVAFLLLLRQNRNITYNLMRDWANIAVEHDFREVDKNVELTNKILDKDLLFYGALSALTKIDTPEAKDAVKRVRSTALYVASRYVADSHREYAAKIVERIDIEKATPEEFYYAMGELEKLSDGKRR